MTAIQGLVHSAPQGVKAGHMGSDDHPGTEAFSASMLLALLAPSGPAVKTTPLPQGVAATPERAVATDDKAVAEAARPPVGEPLVATGSMAHRRSQPVPVMVSRPVVMKTVAGIHSTPTKIDAGAQTVLSSNVGAVPMMRDGQPAASSLADVAAPVAAREATEQAAKPVSDALTASPGSRKPSPPLSTATAPVGPMETSPANARPFESAPHVKVESIHVETSGSPVSAVTPPRPFTTPESQNPTGVMSSPGPVQQPAAPMRVASEPPEEKTTTQMQAQGRPGSIVDQPDKVSSRLEVAGTKSSERIPGGWRAVNQGTERLQTRGHCADETTHRGVARTPVKHSGPVRTGAVAQSIGDVRSERGMGCDSDGGAERDGRLRPQGATAGVPQIDQALGSVPNVRTGGTVERTPAQSVGNDMVSPGTRVRLDEPIALPQPEDRVTLKFTDDEGTEGRLRVAVRGQSVRATIITGDPAAAQRLGTEVTELQQALDKQGFRESQISVQHMQRAADSAGVGIGSSVRVAQETVTAGSASRSYDDQGARERQNGALRDNDQRPQGRSQHRSRQRQGR